MMQEGLKHFTEIPIVIFALILFVAVFAAVTLRTFFNRDLNNRIQHLSELPLAEEDQRV